MMSNNAIGERIRKRRKQLGLTQRSLSEPGMTYSYLCRIEQGVRNPSIKALRKLAPKLQTTPEWLETGEDPVDLVRVSRAVNVALERAYHLPNTYNSQQIRRNLSRILAEAEK